MFSETKTMPSVISPRLYWDLLMALVKENFAKNLSILLKKQGKQAQDLAKHCGVKPSAVTGWTGGRTSPSIWRLDAIASFFGCGYLDLLGPDEPRDVPSRPSDEWDELRSLAQRRGLTLTRDS